MSRSELTLFSRSYPTASQMMMTDMKDALFESQIFIFFDVCLQMGDRALHLATGVWCWHASLCNGVRGLFFNGTRGFHPPPSNVVGRSHFDA